MCSSLWICYMAIFDMTHKSDAGYASIYKDEYNDDWNIGLTNLFDFSYIFLIIIIISEIISGIIIDTLAKLREVDEDRSKD